MSTRANIPAETFLDEVITALIRSDALALRQLEAAAITPPVDRSRYLAKYAVLASLLIGTGRNLRLLRRVQQLKARNSYAQSH
jgi:hypothetical protein